MRIVISSGHGLNIQGADEIVNEVEEARKVVNRVAEMLTSAGVWVAVFHDNTSNEQNENLEAICDFHNSQTRDLDVSVHFNMYNGEAHGTEVFATSQLELARDVASEIAINSGLTDRGGKDGSHLYFINHTEEGAILIEVCFIDHQGDVDKYHRYFEDICQAIAETVGSISIDDAPPQPPDHERPPRPQWPDRPEDVPVEDRPTLRQGDRGDDVLDMQRMIPQFTGEFDGDFGPTTYDNVIRYQRSRGLEADGICGSATWESLYSHAPPVPLPPLPPGALTAEQQAVIIRIANGSEIADYSWHDRGVAPTGFTQGMALAFGQTYKKWKADHPAALEMSEARTNSDKDALNIYRDEFDELDMSNERNGADTLRHLYALMLGHGMRESSGKYCEGRDQSASNVQSDTAEAGLFQTSYNAHSASDPEFDNLMDEYLMGLSPGYVDSFSEGVSCSASDFECFGSPEERGYQFQKLCKEAPAFAAESAALTLRHLANHFGPIVRKESELRHEADQMLRLVQDYVDESEPAVA